MSDSCLFDLLVFLVYEGFVPRRSDGKLPESPAEVKLKAGISVHTQWTVLASAVSGRERARIGEWPDRRLGELLVRRN
jgi:hypothetical protein